MRVGRKQCKIVVFWCDGVRYGQRSAVRVKYGLVRRYGRARRSCRRLREKIDVCIDGTTSRRNASVTSHESHEIRNAAYPFMVVTTKVGVSASVLPWLPLARRLALTDTAPLCAYRSIRFVEVRVPVISPFQFCNRALFARKGYSVQQS